MGNLIILILLLLNLIAFIFFLVRHLKKGNIKDAIGRAVTSAVICTLYIILFTNKYDVISFANFCVFLINFVLAIYGIVREMRKKK